MDVSIFICYTVLSTILHYSTQKTFIYLKKFDNPKILDSLYKGTDEFEDPYCATWLLINNKLTKNIPANLIVTKGSSKSGTRPQVEFKPI